MEATLNNPSENGAAMNNAAASEKSELMQNFERQVHDMYWAYKDLLREIFNDEPVGEA